jgi:hypothetical protein
MTLSRKFDAEPPTIRFRHIKFIIFISYSWNWKCSIYFIIWSNCLSTRPSWYIFLQCDAIVNSTRGDLYLSQGAVSATILAAAGGDIQKECDKIMTRRSRKPLSSAEVEMTKGYNLGCKYVLHGALISSWNEQVWFRDSNIVNMKIILFEYIYILHSHSTYHKYIW